MIKEATNSLKAVLYERINSPIWGTLIISFACFNWESLLILVKDQSPIIERIKYIKETYFVIDGSVCYYRLYIPIIVTILILFLIPWIQNQYFVYTESLKTKSKERRDEYEARTRLSLDQSNELRRRIMNIHSSNQEVSSFQEKEISTLNETIKKLQTQLNEQLNNSDIYSYIDTIKELESHKAKLSLELSEIKNKNVENRLNIKIDAVDIETAFARIIGNKIGIRGTEYDADVFRHGSISDISKALETATEAIKNRFNDLQLSSNDFEAGEIGAQFNVAISRIARIALEMGNSNIKEPIGYHWAIIAHLITIINSTLVAATKIKPNKSLNINRVTADNSKSVQ